jgi:ribonuclease HI
MNILAFFDGACEPVNPGGTASYGLVVFDGAKRIFEDSRIVEPLTGRAWDTSNNLAEYAGFNAALNFALDRQLLSAQLHRGDSCGR